MRAPARLLRERAKVVGNGFDLRGREEPRPAGVGAAAGYLPAAPKQNCAAVALGGGLTLRAPASCGEQMSGMPGVRRQACGGQQPRTCAGGRQACPHAFFGFAGSHGTQQRSWVGSLDLGCLAEKRRTHLRKEDGYLGLRIGAPGCRGLLWGLEFCTALAASKMQLCRACGGRGGGQTSGEASRHVQGACGGDALCSAGGAQLVRRVGGRARSRGRRISAAQLGCVAAGVLRPREGHAAGRSPSCGKGPRVPHCGGSRWRWAGGEQAGVAWA